MDGQIEKWTNSWIEWWTDRVNGVISRMIDEQMIKHIDKEIEDWHDFYSQYIVCLWSFIYPSPVHTVVHYHYQLQMYSQVAIYLF